MRAENTHQKVLFNQFLRAAGAPARRPGPQRHAKIGTNDPAKRLVWGGTFPYLGGGTFSGAHSGSAEFGLKNASLTTQNIGRQKVVTSAHEAVDLIAL